MMGLIWVLMHCYCETHGQPKRHFHKLYFANNAQICVRFRGSNSQTKKRDCLVLMWLHSQIPYILFISSIQIVIGGTWNLSGLLLSWSTHALYNSFINIWWKWPCLKKSLVLLKQIVSIFVFDKLCFFMFEKLFSSICASL